jgi:hypothetical protein
MGDPIRAQFDATQSDPNSSSAYFRLHEQLDKEESLPPHWGKFCGRYLYDILGDKDSDVYYDDDCGQSRMGIEILPCMVASLDGCCQGAPYVNNPELTGLKLHLNPVPGRATSDGWAKAGHIEFNWKDSVSAFFQKKYMCEIIWPRAGTRFAHRLLPQGSSRRSCAPTA